MELSAFEITLIAGCFTILGCLITYYLSRHLIIETHKNAIDILQRQEFNKAAIDFQSAFFIALQRLRDNPEDWPDILNPNILLKHEIAAIAFKKKNLE